MRSRVHILAIAICCAALAARTHAGDPPVFPLPSYVFPFSGGWSGASLRDVDGDGLADFLATAGALRISRGRPDGSFAPYESFAAPDAGDMLALGDVDGDGDLDAVLDYTQFSFQSAGLQVLLNDGDGAFTGSGWTYLGPVGQFAPFVADLDGDGLDDIVAMHSTSNSSTVLVFLASGGGQYGPPTEYPVPVRCFFVQGGDLDLDGDVDLVLPSTLEIRQLRNAGDGSFVTGPVATTVVNPYEDFRILDATGDGRLDATYAAEFDPIFAVSPGQPDGSFGSEIDVALPYVCESVRLAHIDDDGILDLAVSGYPEGTAVLRGLGGLTYEEEAQRVAFFPYRLDVADLNIDGRPDLVGQTDALTVALALDGGGFDSTKRLTVDEDLNDVLLADLDGDGRLDLLEKHGPQNVVQVKLQQPDGSLTLVQTLQGSQAIQTCDFNEDGILDLLRSSSGGFTAAIALGQGDGTFGSFPLNVFAGRDVLLADMNNDGHQDLVGADVKLRIHYGTGTGTFSGSAEWSSPVQNYQIAAADIDQDGWIDILTSEGTYSGPILKWVNTGSGMMLKSFNPPLVAYNLDLQVGDFNGDGDPDLLALPGYVCYGAPSGQFDAPVNLGTSKLPTLCRVVDLDGDGFDDVVSMEASPQIMHVLRGGPSGLSTNAEDFEGGAYGPVALAIGDMDLDGRRDVVAGSHEEGFLDTDDDFLTIHLQKAPSPFADLGSALAGSKGEPELTAVGTLAGGSPLSLRVTSAEPFAPARLIVGTQLLQLPFKGGVLVPLPTLVLPPFPTDAVGKLVLSTAWPAALPSGVSLYAQAWITDAAGPAGFAATNGLKLTTP